MGNEPKGAVHGGGRKSFTANLGNEYERQWSVEKYRSMNQKPLHWYDMSRSHLNFEIGRDGKIRPLGTSGTVLERFRARLAELGETENPKPKSEAEERQQPNKLIDLVFSGDHEVLCGMAFGNQFVDTDLDEKADNSRVQRCERIEQWAKDLHDWLSGKYGVENIVGFEAHLDERTPHIHVQIVPAAPKIDKKTGQQKLVVSYKYHFGKDRKECSERMKQLHTELYENVNRKYGLFRGDPVEGRDVHHRSKYELYVMMKKEIPALETKIKSLRTMVANLGRQIGEGNRSLAELRRALDDGQISIEQFERKESELLSKIRDYEENLADKQQKLMDAMAVLGEKQQEVLASQAAADRYGRMADEMAEEMGRNIGLMVKGLAMDEFLERLGVMFRGVSIPQGLMDRAEGSFVEDFFDGGRLGDVLRTATDVMVQAMDGATTPMPSGGGGRSDDKDWGRKEDEDWLDYCARILQKSHRFHKAMARRIGGVKR